jgi:hypothetical protein
LAEGWVTSQTLQAKSGGQTSVLEYPRLAKGSYTQSYRSLAVGLANPLTVLSRVRQYFQVGMGIVPLVERYSVSTLSGRHSRLWEWCTNSTKVVHRLSRLPSTSACSRLSFPRLPSSSARLRLSSAAIFFFVIWGAIDRLRRKASKHAAYGDYSNILLQQIVQGNDECSEYISWCQTTFYLRRPARIPIVAFEI